MKFSRLLYIIICFLIFNCAGKSFNPADSASSFKNAMSLFNNEKSTKINEHLIIDKTNMFLQKRPYNSTGINSNL